METGLNILAIIPARSGSKRIPGKNKKNFLGKPLIHWTIQAATEARSVTDVVVTTDDEDILADAALFPSVKFYRREAALSTDESSSADVVLDVMSRTEKKYDAFILLQPTSPLRNSVWIDKALHQFCKEKAKQVVGVSACVLIPNLIMQQAGDYIVPLLQGQLHKRSQEWGPLWLLNGSIYISDWEFFKLRKTFVSDLTRKFEMPIELSVDIDTPEDWAKAEALGKELL